MQVYLAHSVWERKKGRKIEREIKSLGYKVYNPFYPPKSKRGDIEKIDRGIIVPWNVKSKKLSNEIVRRDFKAIDSCDIVVAILPKIPTIGIPIEMYYAKQKGKIIIAVTKELAGHPWIIWLSDIVVKNVKELHQELINLKKDGVKEYEKNTI